MTHEYKIVAREDMALLEEEVNRLINQGWELHGILIVRRVTLMQALTRSK